MNDTDDVGSNDLPRRNVLAMFGIAAAGAAGAGALSACAPSKNATTSSGDNATPTTGSDAGTDKGGSTGSDQGGSGGGDKPFHGAYPYTVTPKGHFNYGPGLTDAIQGPGSIYLDFIYPSFGMWYWDAKKWEYMLGTSIKLDAKAKTYTVTLRDGAVWSDGSPITSKDVVATFDLNWLMRQQSWTFLSDVEAKGDSTVVFHIGSPSTVLERYIMKTPILPHSVYGEYADKAGKLRKAKASLDGGEAKSLNQKFQKFRPPSTAVVSGPFVIDEKSITSSQMTMNKNAKGLFADKIAFTKVVLYNGETEDVTPIVMSKAVDYATHGFAVASEKGFEANGFRILRPPVYSGPAVVFNYTAHPEFSDKRVRQAIACIIDRAQNGTVSLGKSGIPVKYMAGFSDIEVPDWISAADQKKLDTYDKDHDRAAKLLEAAGWKKKGSTWMLPNGKPASYEIKFPQEYADWNPSGTNAASQLSSFGIKVTPRGETYTQVSPDVLAGKFDLVIQGWGSSSAPHPYYAFVTDLFSYNYIGGANTGGKGMNFPLKQKTSNGEVDLQKVVNNSSQGLDVATQKKNVLTAALAYNELLPEVPLFERYGNNPALEGVRVKKFPADDDPILKNSPYADNFVIMYMYQNKISPV